MVCALYPHSKNFKHLKAVKETVDPRVWAQM